MHLTRIPTEKKNSTKVVAALVVVLIFFVSACTSNSRQLSKAPPVREETNSTARKERQTFKASDALTALATALEKKPGFKNAEFRAIEIKTSVDKVLS